MLTTVASLFDSVYRAFPFARRPPGRVLGTITPFLQLHSICPGFRSK